MFAYAKTGGGWKLGAGALVLALIAAVVVAAAAAVTPARAAPPAQGNARVSGVEIVSDPLLSNRVGALIFLLPFLTFSSSNSLAPHTSYAAGDVISVDVTFNQPALVVTHGSSPTQNLMLTLGGREVAAGYAGLVSEIAATHRFTYEVTGDDRDNDGLSIEAGALQLHNSWFILPTDEFCAEGFTGPHGATPRDFDCQDYAIELGLGEHTMLNNHRHRVRAQTPEATSNLNGVPVTHNGQTSVRLTWAYSALFADNAPNQFAIRRRLLDDNGRVTREDKFQINSAFREMRDDPGGELLSQGTLQYTIAAKNDYGQGYSPTLVVSR